MRIASIFWGNIEKRSGTSIRVKNLNLSFKNTYDSSHICLSFYSDLPTSIKAKLQKLWILETIYLLKRLREFHPDIVVWHTLGGASRAYICLRLLRIRYVLELHGLPELERLLFRQNCLMRLKQPFLNWIEKQAIEKACLVTTCSPSMTNKLSPLNPNICTLQGGTTLYQTNIVSAKPKRVLKLLYSGNSQPWQGLKFLELTLKQMVKKDFEFEVILILSDHKRIPMWLENNPSVKIYRNLSEVEIQKVTSEANVLILPRELNPVTDISFPSKIYDYMAAGKAIIASDLGDVSTVLMHEKNALLYRPGDIEDFICQLRKVENIKLRHLLGQNAKKDSFEYRWELVGEKFVDLVTSELKL